MAMKLNSDQLDAFFQLSQTGNFSLAAKALSISQSALSQRIKKLEEAIGTSVFVRHSTEARLTPTGEKLLRLCHSRRDLEAEFLQNLQPKTGGLSGVLRISGFSSIMRSIIMPAFRELIRMNPDITIEFGTRKLHELPSMLSHSQTDFVLTDRPIALEKVVSTHLGQEEYVLIESKHLKPDRKNAYFDNDVKDTFTLDFFRHSAMNISGVQRSFLDEIYLIKDAVSLGWGRAVMPRHLIRQNPELQVISKYKPMKSDLYLNYYAQPFYSALHHQIVETLTAGVPRLLKKNH